MSLLRDLYKLVIRSTLTVNVASIRSLTLVCKMFNEHVHDLYPPILRSVMRLHASDPQTDIVSRIHKELGGKWTNSMWLMGATHNKLRIGVHICAGQCLKVMIRVGRWYVSMHLYDQEGDASIVEVQFGDTELPVKSARGILGIARRMYPDVPELRAIRG